MYQDIPKCLTYYSSQQPYKVCTAIIVIRDEKTKAQKS